MGTCPTCPLPQVDYHVFEESEDVPEITPVPRELLTEENQYESFPLVGGSATAKHPEDETGPVRADTADIFPSVFSDTSRI